jgi:hypothetical protein
MVLYVKLPTIFNREISYQISDVYVMAATFIIVFYSTKLTKDVICKKLLQQQKTSKDLSKNTSIIFNPRGGRDQSSLFSNDNEIVEAILYCVRDDHNYRVLDPRIVSLVFRMSGQKLKGQLVTVTPQVIRLLAKVSYRNPSIITKVGNFVLATSNTSVIKIRMGGAAIAGILVSVLNVSALYALLIMATTFQETRYVRCADFFDQLPKSDTKVIDVVSEDINEDMVVITNNDPKDVHVFTPDTNYYRVKDQNTNTYNTKYRRAKKKKAKQVNFSDFKKTDPVLSQIPDEAVKEFEVPERTDRSILQDYTPAEIIDIIVE